MPGKVAVALRILHLQNANTLLPGMSTIEASFADASEVR